MPRLPQLNARFGAFGGKLALLIIGLGLLAIGLGWNGAAGRGSQVKVTRTDGTTTYVTDNRAQIPWLLSGGFLGLSLVVVGSALLVSQSHRQDRARLEAKLDEVIDAVGTGGTLRVSAPEDVSGLVVAGATSYHHPTCRLAQGREDAELLTPAEASDRGLRPCRVCSPDAVEIEVQPR
ncbi:MAG: hypothetical protein ACJ735_04445 [Actinomycetes bacterium]